MTAARQIHRVLVTGIGAVTPIGGDAPSFWEGLRSGRNGIGRVTLCDPEGLPVQISGEVKDFDPEQHLDRRTARRTARFAQFAVADDHEPRVRHLADDQLCRIDEVAVSLVRHESGHVADDRRVRW